MRITREMKDEIIKLLLSGIIKSDICARLGVSLAAVKRVQAESGVIIPKHLKDLNKSSASKKNWSDQAYRNKVTSGVVRDEQYKDKMSRSISTKWKDAEYRNRATDSILARSKSTQYRRLMSDIRKRETINRATSCNFYGTFPHLIAEWHDENTTNLSEYTYGSSFVAKWVCVNGHEWSAAIKDRTRCDRPSGCPKCAHQSSFDEECILDFVKQFYSDATPKVTGLLENKNLEIDVYIPSLRLGIEVCGEYWHRESICPDNIKRHHEKWKQALAAGIRLITIFRSELINRASAVEGYLLAILGKKTIRIHGRKCKIVDIDTATANQFVELNHIQGHTGSYIRYGAYYDDKLVGVMTFTKGNNIWILNRFCVAPGVNIPGLASRMLSKFRSSYSGGIMSFSDNRYSAGKLYSSLGFNKDGDVEPSYWYFKVGKNELLHKFLFRKTSIASKLGPLLPGETEHEAMLRFGYDRIWDCGKIRWLLK